MDTVASEDEVKVHCNDDKGWQPDCFENQTHSGNCLMHVPTGNITFTQESQAKKNALEILQLLSHQSKKRQKAKEGASPLRALPLLPVPTVYVLIHSIKLVPTKSLWCHSRHKNENKQTNKKARREYRTLLLQQELSCGHNNFMKQASQSLLNRNFHYTDEKTESPKRF